MPSNETTIACQECGAPYKTIRSNTKYCRVCQLVRDMSYAYGRTKTCLICDKEYAPLAVKDPPFCGEHSPWGKRGHVEGTCAVSGVEGTLLHEDVRISLAVATDPEKRDLIIRALAKKQEENRKKFQREDAAAV